MGGEERDDSTVKKPPKGGEVPTKGKARFKPLKARKEARVQAREARSMRMKAVAVLVALAVVLSVFGWYFFEFKLKDDTKNRPGRSIKFPDDEGMHNETHEYWRAVFLLTSGTGCKFGVSLTYSRQFDTYMRQVLVTDQGNASGRTFSTKMQLVQKEEIVSERGKLNLTFYGDNELDRVYMVDSSRYDYRIEVSDSNMSKVTFINLSADVVKPPFLIGGSGKIMNFSFGTIWGYSQPRFLAKGTIVLNKTEYSVDGTAWLDHRWGAWVSMEEEYWQFQLESGEDVAAFRAFASETLLYDYFYLVDGTGRVASVIGNQAEALTYWLLPKDPLGRKCVPSRVRLTSASVNLTVEPSVQDQLGAYWWEGAVSVSGTLSGKTVSGRGYAMYSRYAQSTLNVSSVVRGTMEIPTDPVWISADVTDDLSVAEVTIWYNTSLDPTNKSVAMGYKGNDTWAGEIPGQPIGTVVRYYVNARDVADAQKRSVDFDYTV